MSRELFKKLGWQPVTVCIQGLGFVGSAMGVAVASALDSKGEPLYEVIGVDLPTSEGLRRINELNRGTFPFEANDTKLIQTLEKVHNQGNFKATSDQSVYSRADITIVDIHLDVDWSTEPPSLKLEGFKSAIQILGRLMKPGSLILIETTVPPGTTENIVVPIIEKELEARNLPRNSIDIAHSYERVMPGRDYFNSIVNYWRVYAGHTEQAARKCEAFLKTVIDTDKYPLMRLRNTTESELSKVLENTYRATTIALMDEWGRFAENIGVDLYKVVQAIRMRPTHNNMRTPGFGVGGYCLTKDPLFGLLSAREIFHIDHLDFPISTSAVKINQQTPIYCLSRVEKLLGGIKNKKIIVLGVSYRPDIGDTRYSPAEIFCKEAIKKGAEIVVHDPMVKYWEELDYEIPRSLPDVKGASAVIITIPHKEYREMDYISWLSGEKPLIFDGFDVLSPEQRKKLREYGCNVICLGRGE